MKFIGIIRTKIIMDYYFDDKIKLITAPFRSQELGNRPSHK